MFENVSKFSDFDKIAVIMTGMGSDGSKGLVQLKNRGNVIILIMVNDETFREKLDKGFNEI